MPGAPDPQCYIIPGSSAQLFISSNENPVTATTLTWLQVMELDTYTLTSDSTDTALNSGGWIKSLPVERGMSLTATGRLSTLDPGQIAVDESALEIGCGALRYYRFLIPGAHEEDPPYCDYGFWAWANKQDTSAGSTDPFAWGVALQFWAKPQNLQDGQVVALEGGGAVGGSIRGAQPQPQQQQAPQQQQTQGRSRQAAAA